MEKKFIHASIWEKRENYIYEYTRLIRKLINNNQLQQVAIKLMLIMPSLLFQRSSQTSKSKDHIECLNKRLQLWKESNLDMFVREVRYI